MKHSTTVTLSRDEQPAEGSLPTTQTFTIVPLKFGQTVPSAVEELIRPLCPTRTSQSCVYRFASPKLGGGLITVAIKGWLSRERMDEMVHLMELERELGTPQSARLADAPTWQIGYRLHINNPYGQMVAGLLFIALGCMPIYNALFVRDMGPLETTLFFVLGLAMVGLGFTVWFLRGVRRRGWWHRARAVVKARGEKMPESLRRFS